MCETAAALDPYEEFSAALLRFVRRSRSAERSPSQVGEALIRKRRFLDALELDFARDTAAFDDSQEWDRQGSVNAVGWLTNNCHMAPGTAGNAVRVGHQIDGLQAGSALVASGEIGFAHLVHLAGTRKDLLEVGATLDEERLLRTAVRVTPHQFGKACLHARHAAAADAYAATQREHTENRSLRIRPLGDTGCWWIQGFLDPVGGTMLRAALQPLAAREGKDDTRLLDRRLADALVEMASYTLNTGGDATTHRPVPHLRVTATLETLLGLSGAPGGELEGCPVPVSAAYVQQVACTSSISRVLLGPQSEVIDVGRAYRMPPPPMRRAIEARDLGCVWPGCDRSGRWTEIHHVEHWAAENGLTTVANLIVLCTRHHTKAHQGWQVVRVDGQREILVLPPAPFDPFIRGPASTAAA